MSKVREQLMDDAMSKGWFTRKPGTVKVLWSLLGFFVLAGGIALTVLLAIETHAGAARRSRRSSSGSCC